MTSSVFRMMLATLVLAGYGSSAPAQPPELPNIVVLLADDLGYGELGCQGNHQIPTPHIDSIAEAGVRFTAGYVTAPNCSPSRAGLLTGRFPTRFGYEFNPIGAGNEDPAAGLPPSETTIAELLHGAGYTTALIGKWHQGGSAHYHPLRHGFDEFFGFLHEGHFFVPPPYDGVTTMLRRRAIPGQQEGRARFGDLVYSTHMGHDEPPYDADNPILRGGQPVVEQQYLTDAFVRESVDFIDRTRDRPFFLYLAFNAVHSPLQGLDAYMQRFEAIDDVHRRIFAAMLSNLDDGIGRVLESLEQNGVMDNTLVIFLSDNGGPTRELTSSNLPLRGGKGDTYEGGIRVPYMMRYDGWIEAGQVYDEAVSSVDILPTAAAAANVAVSHEIDGVNLLPHIRGERSAAPHPTLYWRQGPKAALRHGDWKIVMPRAARGGSAPWQLFNLAEDLAEQRDQADQRPDQLEELVEIWKNLDREMQPPRFR